MKKALAVALLVFLVSAAGAGFLLAHILGTGNLPDAIPQFSVPWLTPEDPEELSLLYAEGIPLDEATRLRIRADYGQIRIRECPEAQGELLVELRGTAADWDLTADRSDEETLSIRLQATQPGLPNRLSAAGSLRLLVRVPPGQSLDVDTAVQVGSIGLEGAYADVALETRLGEIGFLGSGDTLHMKSSVGETRLELLAFDRLTARTDLGSIVLIVGDAMPARTYEARSTLGDVQALPEWQETTRDPDAFLQVVLGEIQIRKENGHGKTALSFADR